MYHQASYQIFTGEVNSRSWILTIPLRLEMRDYFSLLNPTGYMMQQQN
jgi:hypothetical protein